MKLSDASWLFIDTETTGLKPEEGARVIEVGLVDVQDLKVGFTVDYLINPGAPIPPEITRITKITDQMVAKQGGFETKAQAIMQAIERADFLAAFNKDFDRKMLESEFSRLNMSMPDKVWLDPLTWSRFFEGQADNRLAAVAQRFKVGLENAHRADADAETSANILIKFFQWGIDEAAFPDDIDALKKMERGWRAQSTAKSRIMRPLKDPKTGKVQMTGEPGVLPNVADGVKRDLHAELQEGFDELMRQRLQREGAEWLYRLLREKWGRVK